jgi:hypothetical protein
MATVKILVFEDSYNLDDAISREVLVIAFVYQARDSTIYIGKHYVAILYHFWKQKDLFS